MSVDAFEVFTKVRKSNCPVFFMGLSNFGYAAGDYVGSGLLRLYGGVQPPEFENLAPFVLTKVLIGITPVLLVPFLVPKGTPHDSAIGMGAGKAVGGLEHGMMNAGSSIDGDERAGEVLGVSSSARESRGPPGNGTDALRCAEPLSDGPEWEIQSAGSRGSSAGDADPDDNVSVPLVRSPCTSKRQR